MSGQSAMLSRKEAISLQKKVECGGGKKSYQTGGSGSGNGKDRDGKHESPKTKP